MDPTGKDLVWLQVKIKTPPFSMEARIETGVFLRMLQDGEKLSTAHAVNWTQMPRTTPKSVIETCKKRLKQHDEARRGK